MTGYEEFSRRFREADEVTQRAVIAVIETPMTGDYATDLEAAWNAANAVLLAAGREPLNAGVEEWN